MRVIVATNNNHKVKEIKDVLKPFGYEAISLIDAGIKAEIIENGETFAENAHIKAKSIYELTHEPVIADDSGLEIEFLDNAPGIYSARYGGEKLNDTERCKLILSELHGVSKPLRGARFVCAIYCIFDEKTEFCVSGDVSGFIGETLVGENGFGYDPIFMIDDYESMATIPAETKNSISHRGNALRKFTTEMEKYKNI